MSGVKIDLDAAREETSFAKAKIVIQDESTATPTVMPSAPAPVVEESFEDALNRPAPKSSVKAVISDTKPERIEEPKKSSTRMIADAIREVVNSSRKSATKSSTRPTPTARIGDSEYMQRMPGMNLPSDQRPKPPDAPPPEKVESARLDPNRPDAGPDEIDMMPKTDDELRTFWITRIQTIKLRFPDVIIPRNAATMSWQELRKVYYMELDRCSITKNVDSIKMIMIVMFFIAEGIVSNIFKIDCVGFAAHSMRSMHRYDRLLIELGEKSYSAFGENWPIEFRLAGMVMLNMVIYCLAKFIFKKTGQDMSDNFFEMFQSLGNQTVETDMKPGTGMDTPGPGGNQGNGGGLGGMLSGLLGALGGGAGGGLDGILNMFTGGGQKPPPGTPTDVPTDPDGNRVKPPSYRRKKKPATTPAG